MHCRFDILVLTMNNLNGGNMSTRRKIKRVKHDMTLYNNQGFFIHKIDRLPEKESDFIYLQEMFPNAIVIRISNNKAIWLNEAKFKNIHWYK